jgi:hypothetical protein
VAAHAHPETGDALALAAGSFEGAFGHGLISAAASWAIHHPIRRVVGARLKGRPAQGEISITQLPR